MQIFQIIGEIIHSRLIELPSDIEKEYFSIMDSFSSTFNRIKDDLFNNLMAIPEINNEEYQVIFIGHSLGGAIATISSFYFLTNYNFNSENILITFGHPKVGSEHFARYLTSNLKQIYRIARPNDIATLFPFKEMDYIFKSISIFKGVKGILEFLSNIFAGNVISIAISLIKLFKDRDDIIKEYSFIFKETSSKDFLYSHTGGLYMIDDSEDKVYHCTDFFNENRNHFICKNNNIKLSLSLYNDFMKYRKYLSLEQDMVNSCDKKGINNFIKIVYPDIIKFENKFKVINSYNKYSSMLKQIRKINYIENSEKLIALFTQVNLDKRYSEFFYKYQTENKLKNKNLILIVNPKNTIFFGKICFSKNIFRLIENNYNFINCYFINNKRPFSLNILLKEEIIEEKALYIYIKGKVKGNIEIYDLEQEKILNMNSSYFIPFINNFPSEKNINFILPKIQENIYINVIINNYDKNDKNKISSIFEIYKNKAKIDYDKNILLLEKNNEFYFKYYPKEYELIINFIDIYLNKCLERIFYILKGNDLYFNYNIKSININSTFGLFFDIDGIINIEGFFSNQTEYQDNIKNYSIKSNNHYFNLLKDNQYNFFNLKINTNIEFVSELKIFEINELIIIYKINIDFTINKGRNYYLFLFDKNMQKDFSIFDSYLLLSICNKNNNLKIVSTNGGITSSKNQLFSILMEIESIFIKVFEDDIFKITLIPEETSKYITDGSNTIFGNTFIEDKNYSIEFIYNKEESFAFFNQISTNLVLFELNNESNFNVGNFINNYNENFDSFSGLKNMEEEKTYIILKESSGQYLYEKYINIFFDFNFILDESKICYLYMDFEYSFLYNKNMKKLLFTVLNYEHNKTTINLFCDNEEINITDNYQEVNIEKCNGEFTLAGNNSQIYIYLPFTMNEEYIIIENQDSFHLTNIYQFFFVPKKNVYNSINILLNLDYTPNDYPVYFTYYIEFGIIPYSRNLEKNHIFIKNETNIIIPNFSNHSTDNEKFYIFFYFNATISKLNAKVIYENIIYLDEQAHIILKPGTHFIKFKKDRAYYLNITKLNNDKNNISYTIYKNNKLFKKMSDSNSLIYLQEPSYNENEKIKIENKEDILLCTSTENFHNLSGILSNKYFEVVELENSFKIKFNNIINYKSKIEYYISLVKKIERINQINPISLQNIIFKNHSIYKTIIYSNGIQPIEVNISLNNYIYSNEKYDLIVLGKYIYGDSYNYLYFDSKTIFIKESNNPKQEDKSKKSTVIIACVVIFTIVGVGGIAFGLIIYFKKKKLNKKNSVEEIGKNIKLINIIKL